MMQDRSVLKVEGINDAILSSIPCGILVIDVASKVLYINREVEEIFGYSAGDLVGRSLLPDRYFRPLIALINEHRKSVPPLVISHKEVEQEFTRRDGAKIPLDFSIASLANQDRSVLGYVVVCRDLTQMRLLEDRAKRAEAMAALGAISAGVAHEIRNPLHAIRGATELLGLRLKENPEVASYLAVIADEIERADRIIQDVLNYSKIPRLNLAPADINTVVRRYLDRMDLPSPLEVAMDLMGGLPEVCVDEGKIGQVLCNLVNNAVESMKGRGNLRVATSLDPGPENPSASLVRTGFVRIDISDSGPGIRPSDLPLIFDLFYSAGKKERGTGLGLAICRKIVEAHQGFLGVQSAAGQGATFSVYLPVS